MRYGDDCMGACGHFAQKRGGGDLSEGDFCSFDYLKLPSSLSFSTNPVFLYFYDARFGPKTGYFTFFGGGRRGGR